MWWSSHALVLTRTTILFTDKNGNIGLEATIEKSNFWENVTVERQNNYIYSVYLSSSSGLPLYLFCVLIIRQNNSWKAEQLCLHFVMSNRMPEMIGLLLELKRLWALTLFWVSCNKVVNSITQPNTWNVHIEKIQITIILLEVVNMKLKMREISNI